MGRHSASSGAAENDAEDNSVDVLVSDRPDGAAIKEIGRPTPHGRHASAEPAGGAASQTTVTQAPTLEEPVDALDDEAVLPQPLGDLDVVLLGVADPDSAPDVGRSDFGDAESAAADPKRRPRGTRADLRLLRTDRTLLARCLAAVLVPFVLYTLVLLVIGKLGVYLLWIWIPAILAGVLLGTFLDSAHKRSRA